MVGVLIIPPSHCPIVETFPFFLFLFFSGCIQLAVDTDSWQISEIIIVIIFSGYLSFAWQNVKSTEFQFCIVLW